jgi:hypothetical protein
MTEGDVIHFFLQPDKANPIIHIYRAIVSLGINFCKIFFENNWQLTYYRSNGAVVIFIEIPITASLSNELPSLIPD